MEEKDVRPFLHASEGLYNLLIKPVQEELAPYDVLGIIPNGKLHLLPFHVLGVHSPEGKFQFLLERKSLFQLKSQSILKFARNRGKPIASDDKMIAFGNPDYSLN